jgi:hypothetical protein
VKRSVLVAACAAALVLGGAPAMAANPHPGGGGNGGGGSGGGGGGGGTSVPSTGIDVSYPQCGDVLPTDEAFAVVGVNGGLANIYNDCLAEQFTYAKRLTPGGTTQPVAQTYLNTADPGNSVADWPSPGQLGAYGKTTTPDYGDCVYASGGSSAGANSPACAYIYGYDMVAGITTEAGVSIVGDAPYFTEVTGGSLGDQPVWLDVETANSWLSGPDGLAMNIAALQGMVDAVHETGSAPVGIYSTAYQWDQITGTPTGDAAGNLVELPVWVPGARRESSARDNCAQDAFTGGTVVLAQWFGHPYDGNVSCVG